jgi:hypothetical protein
MRWLLTAFIILSGCTALKRKPSSINGSDSIFNLINSDSLLQTRYSFELLSLSSLTEKKLVFRTYDVAVMDSKKAVDAWTADLHNFVQAGGDVIRFRSGTSDIVLKQQDLIRLDQALSLLAKSSDNPENVYRRQIEVLSAFNQNLKPKDTLGSISTNIPIEFVNAESKESYKVTDSSFWKSSTDRRQSFRPVDVQAEEFSKIRCKTSDNQSGKDLGISCGPTHFILTEQPSPRVAVLNSILYRRLGYNTPALIYQPQVEINYDRNLIAKMASLNPSLTVRMKNGDMLNFSQLSEKLIPYCKSHDSNCYSSSAIFESAAEEQIDKVILSDVALTVDFGDHDFGPWGFDELDHKFRREVKGMLFVGALTGNSDLRKENNSLVWSAKNFSISHQIRNLNAGFGRLRAGTPMNLNVMPWEVLKTKKSPKGIVYIFDGYRPAVKRQAFSDLNVEDAKWAVRQIASISEGEFTEALYHSGFSVAETLLAREKLISIQKNMVETLGLSDEFPSVASRKIDRHLNYRIQRHIQSFDLTPTRTVHVPENGDELYNGVLRKKAINEK